MASSLSLTLLPITHNVRAQSTRANASITRRQALWVATTLTTAKFGEAAGLAEDIPLFGIRRLKKVEEEAEELVKEGEKLVEEGLEVVKEDVEKGFGGGSGAINVAADLGQALGVAGAEVVGLVVASSVVNGILGPEAQKP
ncbi:hypothetical protein AMTRI_Chr07g76390 [Amborella trichopoda]|uniref:Uncharacterized protein n=1 Tax=Amborella trichopoda TaxID=13333 RepID=U5D6D7_AMBTC|nr:uncharacterized protein LOC18444218 [Amborella trichopoda]ERN15923.1 hypothetical protein AMTR_s00039p00227400 [Amborella trichopoda]|eukprot:XP_006854456.1 uncharacterized protein LOC18444218 [Amborella trichopoda]